jgi:exopolysaccharide production protein ExoQ
VFTGNTAETSPLDQAFFLFVLLASLLVAGSRRVMWGKLFAQNSALMLFYVYFAVSVLWSGDPTGSTKRLVKDFGMLFVMAILWSETHPLVAIRSVYVRCASILFPLSLVFDKYFPNIARAYSRAGEPMSTGVTTQKNSLGELVLIFSLFLIWDLLEEHRAHNKLRHLWDRFLLLLIGLWLLHSSESKTALVCLLVGAALALRTGWLASRSVSTVVLAVTFFLPYLALFAQQFNSIIAPVVNDLGRNMTFTGRTDIWRHITLETVNPVVGAGYWNFWGGPGGFAIGAAMKTLVPNAHNGYLDIYLDGGAIGLIMLAALLIASGRRLIKGGTGRGFEGLRFSILIVVMIYNLSESTFARLGTMWFATVLALTDFSTATPPVGASHGERPQIAEVECFAPRYQGQDAGSWLT